MTTVLVPRRDGYLVRRLSIPSPPTIGMTISIRNDDHTDSIHIPCQQVFWSESRIQYYVWWTTNLSTEYLKRFGFGEAGGDIAGNL